MKKFLSKVSNDYLEIKSLESVAEAAENSVRTLSSEK